MKTLGPSNGGPFCHLGHMTENDFDEELLLKAWERSKEERIQQDLSDAARWSEYDRGYNVGYEDGFREGNYQSDGLDEALEDAQVQIRNLTRQLEALNAEIPKIREEQYRKGFEEGQREASGWNIM